MADNHSNRAFDNFLRGEISVIGILKNPSNRDFTHFK
jgi:hypothetical protein